MTNHFKQIVLIDDDSTTNFLNKMIIQKTELVDEVVVFDEPEEALKYFQENSFEYPSLILLDINMPVMNGWEFLEEYEPIEKKNGNSIVMLTSSIDPEDKQKAEEFSDVVGYRSKPLTIDMLQKLVKQYL